MTLRLFRVLLLPLLLGPVAQAQVTLKIATLVP